MNMVDIIIKKKEGGELTEEEIRYFAQGAADGSIPDYQLSALMMAICFQGMNAKETTCLTMEMMKSGGVVDLSAIDGVCVDKHSTAASATRRRWCWLRWRRLAARRWRRFPVVVWVIPAERSTSWRASPLLGRGDGGAVRQAGSGHRLRRHRSDA